MITISFDPMSFGIGFLAGLVFYWMVREFIPYFLRLKKLDKKFREKKP